ncbi:MAG: DUF885 family protein [Candidatus Deferrimicrobiaceae bacterium]
MEDILQPIAENLFDYLGKTFPVCCGSDEFYYFPQIIPAQGGWAGWDNFTPEKIGEVTRRLSSVEEEIGLFSGKTEDRDLLADAETLKRMVRTLREQFGDVRFHETQPTFHLTVMCVGLAASLGDSDHRAWSLRANTLPSFLTQARETLTDMPRLFRDLGLGMTRDIKAWLKSLEKEKIDIAPVYSAVLRFEDFLRSARTKSRYLLPPEIVERIVKEHMGCGVASSEVRDAILEEISEMGGILETGCADLFPGDSWKEAIRKIPLPDIPEGGTLALYREEADNLLRHCIRARFVPEDLPAISPLRIETLPPYLEAIRAASAYSFTPENPTRGGTFFVVPREGPWDDNREDLADYRMLTAHEAYPGHHLLDSWRWHFVSPTRRPVEMPLFYEGWACFAEELMRVTGYFSGPVDLLLLAKRRYRRAVRGLVDLDLQTGTIDERQAACLLADSGIPTDAASSVVAKYALRPGYQVCYTFGLRRFLDLYSRYGTDDVKRFVEAVLSCGEIGFEHVENQLQTRFG